MALISRSNGLIYIQVPATGCSVVAKALKTRLGAKEIGHKHSDVPDLLRRGLISTRELNDLLVVANVRNPFDRFATYYQRITGAWFEDEYMGVLRRRLARMSNNVEIDAVAVGDLRSRIDRDYRLWRRRHKLLRMAGFNVWFLFTILRWSLESRQKDKLCACYFFPMLSGVDVVLKQEFLQRAVFELSEIMNINPRIELAVKNITPGKKPFINYYNSIGSALARRLCRQDMERFAYRFAHHTHSDAIVAITTKGKRALTLSQRQLQ